MRNKVFHSDGLEHWTIVSLHSAGCSSGTARVGASHMEAFGLRGSSPVTPLTFPGSQWRCLRQRGCLGLSPHVVSFPQDISFRASPDHGGPRVPRRRGFRPCAVSLLPHSLVQRKAQSRSGLSGVQRLLREQKDCGVLWTCFSVYHSKKSVYLNFFSYSPILHSIFLTVFLF